MAAIFPGSFNQTTDRINTTEKPHEVVLCPGFPNARFETLDSSSPYFVNAALNAPLAIATTFANLLVLLAMRHVTSIRLPSKLLLCSLVLTDLGTGLVVQPQFAALLFSKAFYPGHVQCQLYKAFYFDGPVFNCASFFSLTAISLDRYAALFFHFKYQQIVTTRRVCVVVAFIWSLSMSVAWMSLLERELWWGFVATATVVNFSVVSLVCIKIHRRLRAQQDQPQAAEQAQQPAGSTPNMERYGKTASAMMWVYVVFVVCYVPYWCAASVVTAIGETTLTLCLDEFSYTFVLLNSFLNPFVYCLRLPEIRTEVLKQLRKLSCRSS